MVFEVGIRRVGRCGLLLFVLGAGANGLCQSNTDSLLQALHQAIEKKEVYVQAKLERIQRLKNQLPEVRLASPVEQFELYMKLCQEYQIFIYDSAFTYAKKLSNVSYRLRDPS